MQEDNPVAVLCSEVVRLRAAFLVDGHDPVVGDKSNHAVTRNGIAARCNYIFMAIPLAKRERKGYTSWWHTAYIICLTTGIVAGLFQHFAEGILILALSLLIRFVITYRRLNAKLPEMANKQQ